jgi:hypothetical protein
VREEETAKISVNSQKVEIHQLSMWQESGDTVFTKRYCSVMLLQGRKAV